MTSEWKECKVGNVIYINPVETLKKREVYKKIPMEKLIPFCRDIPEFEYSEYSVGTKFRNYDTIIVKEHFK